MTFSPARIQHLYTISSQVQNQDDRRWWEMNNRQYALRMGRRVDSAVPFIFFHGYG
uniref:Alpha/beta hydrolase n=1 Tax=Arundo donax TaxID=35708 RepID=A0A0A9B198_ARUDO